MDMAIIDTTIETLEGLQLPTVLKTGKFMFDSDTRCQLERNRDNTDEVDVVSTAVTIPTASRPPRQDACDREMV
jgi:hypothetical protein